MESEPPNGQHHLLVRVWEDPIAHPNLRGQDSPELAARSACRVLAVLGRFIQMHDP